MRESTIYYVYTMRIASKVSFLYPIYRAIVSAYFNHYFPLGRCRPRQLDIRFHLSVTISFEAVRTLHFCPKAPNVTYCGGWWWWLVSFGKGEETLTVSPDVVALEVEHLYNNVRPWAARSTPQREKPWVLHVITGVSRRWDGAQYSKTTDTSGRRT